MTLRALKSDNEHIPCVIIIDHHPNDSRTKIAEDQNNCQAKKNRLAIGVNLDVRMGLKLTGNVAVTLTSRMGTGGG